MFARTYEVVEHLEDDQSGCLNFLWQTQDSSLCLFFSSSERCHCRLASSICFLAAWQNRKHPRSSNEIEDRAASIIFNAACCFEFSLFVVFTFIISYNVTDFLNQHVTVLNDAVSLVDCFGTTNLMFSDKQLAQCPQFLFLLVCWIIH